MRALRWIAMAAATATPLVASAQRIGTIEAGVHAGLISYDSKLGYENGPAIGGSIGTYIFPRLQAFAEDGITPTKRAGVTQKHYPFRTGLLYDIPLSGKWYLGLGGGYNLDAYPDETTANKYEDGFFGTAKLRVCMKNDWNLSFGGVMDQKPSPNRQSLDGTSNNMTFRVGISKFLNGNKEMFGTGRGVCEPAAPPPP
ncbi:MAG: porin family protein, partial [Gemmatimonadaceae bacterium]|nr:porin family protein [Gemmatimonadaceae bacterium]